jgi:hypothetical protein
MGGYSYFRRLHEVEKKTGLGNNTMLDSYKTMRTENE